MSANNITSLNNNKTAQAPTSRGQGPAGTVAATTTTLVKAVAVTPSTVSAAAVHNGGYVTPATTAAGFDRTVVTSLGK